MSLVELNDNGNGRIRGVLAKGACVLATVSVFGVGAVVLEKHGITNHDLFERPVGEGQTVTFMPATPNSP